MDSIRLHCAYQFCFKVRKGLRLKHNRLIWFRPFAPLFGSLVVRQTKQGVGVAKSRTLDRVGIWICRSPSGMAVMARGRYPVCGLSMMGCSAGLAFPENWVKHRFAPEPIQSNPET